MFNRSRLDRLENSRNGRKGMRREKCISILMKISSIEDINKRHIESIKKWFKGIKVFDGKKANTIHFGEKIFGKDKTLAVIHEAHEEWKNLLSNEGETYKKIRREYHLENVRKT